MKVKQLVVINLCDSFSVQANLEKPYQLVEDRETAFGLYQKHVSKEDGFAPKVAYWIEVNNTEKTGDAESFVEGTDYRIMLPTNGVFKGLDEKERDVGVYIIYHAKNSSDPNIFGVKPIEKAENKAKQAGRLVGVLSKLKIRPIRKLALVGCHSDSGKTAASKNFLVAFGKEIEKWGEDRPMIAGYDDFVTGDWKTGKKLATNEKVKATGHKHVWCYRSGLLGGGYKLVELSQSGWSDKTALNTSIGKVAVFQ